MLRFSENAHIPTRVYLIIESDTPRETLAGIFAQLNQLSYGLAASYACVCGHTVVLKHGERWADSTVWLLPYLTSGGPWHTSVYPEHLCTLTSVYPEHLCDLKAVKLKVVKF